MIREITIIKPTEVRFRCHFLLPKCLVNFSLKGLITMEIVSARMTGTFNGEKSMTVPMMMISEIIRLNCKLCFIVINISR